MIACPDKYKILHFSHAKLKFIQSRSFCKPKVSNVFNLERKYSVSYNFTDDGKELKGKIKKKT